MILIFLLILPIIVWYLFNLHYKYWERRGVPGPKPKWIVGNMGQSFLMKKNPGEIFTDIYKSYPEEPIVGAFRSSTPVLLIREPEVIKEVLIKSFNNFRDNDIELSKENDPLFGRHPFCLKGDEWKMVRAQLTPGFTSGKMKWLYPHLEENSEQMIKFVSNQKDAFNGNGYEAKELCTRFALNNVANCAFGLEGKCFEEENSEFRQMAQNFLTPGSWTMVVMFLLTLVPSLLKFLHMRLTPKFIEDKLKNIVSQTLKYREENNIVRNDFLHILSQLKKTCKDYEFTDVDVTAHAAGFFGDGYETSSLAMSMVLFELASNPDKQAKLREEVQAKFSENNDKLPYDVLQDMTYLDAVFCESMRLHPPVYALFKVCTNTHTLTSSSCGKLSKAVTIEKGTPLIIPIFGLQNDPKLFPDAEIFKPERFLGANKEKIEKGTYMPFGEGPRACLGQRFGILQIKVGLAYIIKNYKLSLNKKTKLPLKFDVTNIMLLPVGGVWIDFEKIASS